MNSRKFILLQNLILLIFFLPSCKDPQTNTEKEEETDTILLPKQSQCELLIEKGVISPNAFLFADGEGTPYLAVDSLVFYIGYEKDDTIPLPPLYFHNGIIPSSICCFLDDDIWFIEDRKLCTIEGGDKSVLFEFPSKDIHIRNASTNGVYITFYDDIQKQYKLLYINKNEQKVESLTGSNSPLSAIGFGNMTFVASDSAVYFLNGDKTTRIFKVEENINQLAFAPEGIFYITPSAVGYFYKKVSFEFMKKPIRDMLSVDSTLYLLSEEGTLYRITHTEHFKELAESLLTK